MLNTDNASAFYLDSSGHPLQNGVVYFGLPGLNPATNPVTVFWDSAGTQPAAQPVAIANGRTVRQDGTPSRIWVVGDYSKLVQDAKGRQVVYETNQPQPPTVQQSVTDRFSGTGAPATFTLSATPADATSLDVYVAGVYQQKNSYTLVGNQLTITAAAAANNVEAVTRNTLNYANVAQSIATSLAAATGGAAAATASAAAASHIYTGTYATDPTTRPGGSAIQAGDVYFNSTANLNKRFNGATWVSSDINTANLAAPTGTSLVGQVAAGAGAVGRTAQDKLREIEVSVYDFYLAADGSDILPAANRALAALALAGGGRLVFPWQSTAYQISDTVIVSSSNITIELNANVTLTKTSATDASPHQAFRFAGTTSTPIDNPALISPNRRVTIDCNGRNVTGYTHATGKSHFGVLFQFCKNIRLENIYAYNGLVGCIATSFCLGGGGRNCDASNSVYDNGIYSFNNGGAWAPFSDTDPSTWANLSWIDCRAWSCANHGLGVFGAVGVTYINPKIWNCGNNTGTAIAGPAGGLGIEFDGTNATRNYRFTAINVDVANSWGVGIRTNCRGTRILGGEVRNTKVPTAYTDTTPPIWGSAVFVQSGATECEIVVDIAGSERFGLRMALSGTNYPGAKYKGTVTGCVEQAVYAGGFSFLELDPSCYFHDNGDASHTTASTFYTVEATNAGGNTNNGTVILAGRFDNNKGGCGTVSAVGYVDLTRGISGRDNQAAYSSAYHAIYIPSCVELEAGNISLTDTLSKQSRVLKCDAATRAVFSRSTILGTQTNVNLPKADVTATTLSADYYIGLATYDPASVAAGAYGPTTTVTVPGARPGDQAAVSFIASSALQWHGVVSANDTVTVYPFNPTAAAIDLGSGTVIATARKVLG